MERLTDIRIGAKTYRLVSDDEYLSAQGEAFEPAVVALFESLVAGDHAVLDVGANIGCTTLLFGERARCVNSFEPSPTTFSLLARNVAASGLSNIALHNYALGAAAGETELTFWPHNRAGAFVSDRTRASAGHVTERVQMRTLDEAVAERALAQIDFVKIDVEGFEKNVLEGGRTTIDRCRPVVVLELNHWCLNAFQSIAIPDFFAYLRSRFPVLLAVDQRRYLDLHDEGESYAVMLHHINRFRFPNLIGAFDPARLVTFFARFAHRG